MACHFQMQKATIFRNMPCCELITFNHSGISDIWQISALDTSLCIVVYWSDLWVWKAWSVWQFHCRSECEISACRRLNDGMTDHYLLLNCKCVSLSRSFNYYYRRSSVRATDAELGHHRSVCLFMSCSL